MTYPYKAAVFAKRNRNIVYEAVVKAVESGARARGMTRKDIAIKLGKKAPQISNWLKGPSNWTLDTISDLLYAVDATMDYGVIFNKDRLKSNVFNDHVRPIDIQSITNAGSNDNIFHIEVLTK